MTQLFFFGHWQMANTIYMMLRNFFSQSAFLPPSRLRHQAGNSSWPQIELDELRFGPDFWYLQASISSRHEVFAAGHLKRFPRSNAAVNLQKSTKPITIVIELNNYMWHKRNNGKSKVSSWTSCKVDWKMQLHLYLFCSSWVFHYFHPMTAKAKIRINQKRI